MKLQFQRIGFVLATLSALAVAPIAHAATNPSLGAAESYSILAQTGITGTGTISGNVENNGIAAAITGLTTAMVAGTIYSSDGGFTTGAPPAPTTLLNAAVQANASTVYTATIPGLGIEGTPIVGSSLNGITRGPGVYDLVGASITLTTTLTLDGPGTYIFRVPANFTSSGSINFINGARACDLFWNVGTDATINGTSFAGTILASTGIHIGAGVTLNGRALAVGADVTLLGTTISGPSCAAAAGSTATTPPLINVRKVPSPLALPNGPGPVTYNYTVTNPGNVTMHTVTLVDDKCANVTFVSGDTNGNSLLETFETWTYTCNTTLTATTVNYATARGIANDIAAVDTAIAQVIVGVPVVPPLIHIVKTPSPLSLPFNGGNVTYSYVVTNPGTVALSNVTVVDDKCANVTYVSGDTNGNSQLSTTETWRYTCTTNLSQSTVNTAIATGQANGLTAIDTALATVLLAGSPIPPLIHVIKKADPVILPAAGGQVIYTYEVSNPGTVLLNNVSVSDDKCGPVTMVSGDVNGNGMLGPTETWIFRCQQNLTASTINTATAQGTGNGITVSDVAVASVVLSPALIPAPPALPNTGVAPADTTATWMAAFAGILLMVTLLFAVTQWKRLFR
ncbi:ice-binding family protein [Candidatus Uhrbacteria bacterium]|nr:ice-binding family protein [Candidatus Uhrbacteria bacterium]